MGGAVVRTALVQKTVILRHPENRLSALASGPAVAPNIAIAFVGVHTSDPAWFDDAASVLYD